MKAPKIAPKIAPTIGTRFRVLSCSKCDRTITVRVGEDPTDGHGWPQHRCGREVRPFDKQTEAESQRSS